MNRIWPILVTVRSLAYFCGRSMAKIAGSNFVRGKDFDLLCM